MEKQNSAGRVIKFRAWDSQLKRWEYWTLPQDAGYIAGRFNEKNKKSKRFDLATLTEFTGLRDKNGEEIYEGDIVRHFFEHFPGDMSDSDKRLVEWNANTSSFDLSWPGRDPAWFKFGGTKCEIIGNIYENPELLK